MQRKAQMVHFNTLLNMQRALSVHEGPAAVVHEINGRPTIIVKAPASYNWHQEQVDVKFTYQPRLFGDGVYIQCDVEFRDETQDARLFYLETHIDAVQKTNLVQRLINAASYEVLVFDEFMRPVFKKYLRAQPDAREMQWTAVGLASSVAQKPGLQIKGEGQVKQSERHWHRHLQHDVQTFALGGLCCQ